MQAGRPALLLGRAFFGLRHGLGVIGGLGLGDGLDVVVERLDVHGEGEPAVLAVELQAGVHEAADEFWRGYAVLFFDGTKDIPPLGIDTHADLVAEFGHEARMADFAGKVSFAIDCLV